MQKSGYLLLLVGISLIVAVLVSIVNRKPYQNQSEEVEEVEEKVVVVVEVAGLEEAKRLTLVTQTQVMAEATPTRKRVKQNQI